MMNLTMEVEDHFNVDIPINALAEVNTIGDLVTLLMQRTGGS
ncbi:acyl carrier protein [Defluviicoccus vanus]|uniref:Acyl carrier protein n=2 Tax=Defluviicoccus vanus TaxID=111831 RepID=A0A7H1N216_9PROT|nr:acyl carrier protein [Defluviicoccus vanus]